MPFPRRSSISWPWAASWSVPVGSVYDNQVMTIIRKTDKGVVKRETLPVRFVPMRREVK